MKTKTRRLAFLVFCVSPAEEGEEDAAEAEAAGNSLRIFAKGDETPKVIRHCIKMRRD